jgi:hypothetical protein
MPDGLPSFLMFNRRKRGSTDVRANEPEDVMPGDGPNNTPDAAARSTPPAVKRMAPALDPVDVDGAPPAAPVGAADVPEPAAPVVTGEQRRRMGPAPHMVDPRGRTVTTPTYDDTGDHAADLENYRRSLADQRNPKDRDGRLKTGVKEAARGFLENFVRGGLYQGVRGAAVRGIYGAAVPNVDERRARDREIGRVEEEQGRVRAEQGWAAKLREAEEESAQRRAVTKKTEVETELLPEKAEAAETGRTQTRLLAQLRLAGRYKRGESAAFDRKLDDAGLMVMDFEKGGKIQWKEAGGQVYLLDDKTGRVTYATAEGQRVEDASKKPNAEGLTPSQAKLAEFRKTALYEQIRQREADRAAANARHESGIAAADARAAAGRAATDKRAAAQRRISQAALALQAVKEGRTVEELVREAESLGYETYDDPEQ